MGHSVTLALVSLGILTVPESFAELLIAASIFLLAVVLAGPARPFLKEAGKRRDEPSLVACWGFRTNSWLGACRGIGRTGDPKGGVATALLGFNLGIEIGQLLFVGVLFFFLVAAPWLPSNAGRGASVYATGGASAYWCIDRLGTLLAESVRL